MIKTDKILFPWEHGVLDIYARPISAGSSVDGWSARPLVFPDNALASLHCDWVAYGAKGEPNTIAFGRYSEKFEMLTNNIVFWIIDKEHVSKNGFMDYLLVFDVLVKMRDERMELHANAEAFYPIEGYQMCPESEKIAVGFWMKLLSRGNKYFWENTAND